MPPLTLVPLAGLPRVEPGDDLAALLLAGLERAGETLRDGDVLALAQKIVSKAEGRFVALAEVSPSARARELAAVVDKDPRVVELILRESRQVVRAVPGVLVVEHRLGFLLANAGIDHSNVEQEGAGERVLLLPADSDRSAAALRERLRGETGADVGVVIVDSWGRPWRLGTVGFAIGVAGLPALVDLRGALDLEGRPLQVTEVGHADQIAAAASILFGQAAEGIPAVLLRGLPALRGESPASALLRPRDKDLFR
ncbi:MAG TPA: coenzyme F420-0:L-glutamate ligase [Thermoanaerobaculia bacterium]|nr:coenzyme F420-0:L-glutamate ligase [Thermoanaerobaculia bacterium]